MADDGIDFPVFKLLRKAPYRTVGRISTVEGYASFACFAAPCSGDDGRIQVSIFTTQT